MRNVGYRTVSISLIGQDPNESYGRTERIRTGVLGVISETRTRQKREKDRGPVGPMKGSTGTPETTRKRKVPRYLPLKKEC